MRRAPWASSWAVACVLPPPLPRVPAPASSMRLLPSNAAFALLLALPAFAVQSDEPSSWPQFRGPAGHPISEDRSIPLDFGPERHLQWRAALPAGHSSPCVHGGKVFLTGQLQDRGVIVAVDQATGHELWRRSFQAEAPPQYSHADAVPAVSTPCADGERVFAYVDSYGLVALDLEGQLLWEERLPHPGYGFGVGTSPIVAGGNVILSRDGAPEAAVFAFDAATGEVAWKIDRFGFIESHGTPFLWSNADREELIIGGTSQVCSFDPKTGAPLWNVSGVTVFSCTTPTADADTLFFGAWSTPNATGRSFWEAGFGRSLELSDAEVADPNLLFDRLDANDSGTVELDELPECRAKDAFGFLDQNGNGVWERPELITPPGGPASPGANVLMAIRRGGDGDVTESHVEWTWKRGLPYVASPLLYRDRIWLMKAGGIVSAIDAASGKRVLDRERLPDRSEYYMSPMGLAGHVLVGSAEGTLYVLDADSEGLEIVHYVDFEDGLFATPAVVDGSLFVRTENTLWCFRGD